MLLALAPMKDVTDLAFLNTLKDLNSLPDYFITEYFRTVAHHKKMSPYILRSIDENPTGRPIYGQLVGHEPEYLARDAQVLMEHACAGVDLNMGCPAPIVCRRNAGGGMLRSLKAMDAALGALRDVLPPGRVWAESCGSCLPVPGRGGHPRPHRPWGLPLPGTPGMGEMGRRNAEMPSSRQRKYCGCSHSGGMGAAGPASWADDWTGSPAQSLDIFTASFPLSGPSCSRPYFPERAALYSPPL